YEMTNEFLKSMENKLEAIENKIDDDKPYNEIKELDEIKEPDEIKENKIDEIKENKIDEIKENKINDDKNIGKSLQPEEEKISKEVKKFISKDNAITNFEQP